MLLKRAVLVCLVGLSAASCGSRTSLRNGQEDVLVACRRDTDCDQENRCEPQICIEGFCAYDDPVVCGPAPECSEVSCNPGTGACETTRLTQDLDGDGFYGPLPGTIPNAPGSCGDDCDDNNFMSNPAGQEVCDGIDNDCDGIVDNGSDYFAGSEDVEAVRIGESLIGMGDDDLIVGVRGLAYGDGVYFISFFTQGERQQGYIQGIDQSGAEVFPPTLLTQARGPTFAADVTWSGEAFGALWSDVAAGEDYEIYFGLFDPAGNKLRPDQRVTDAPDFSIRARIIFDQGRFVGTWEDHRSGSAEVYAQLFAADGERVGGNVSLTDPLEGAESPFLAATDDRFGLVYLDVQQNVDSTTSALRFRSFSKDFSGGTPPVTLASEFASRPRIVAAEDHFVVTWDEYLVDGNGPSILGAVVDEQGNVLVGSTPITEARNGVRARTNDAVSLGDRIAVFWSANYSGGYEIYGKTIDPMLRELEPRARLTRDLVDSFGVEAYLGEQGRVGVVYNDYSSEFQSSQFLTVGCGVPAVEEPPVR